MEINVIKRDGTKVLFDLNKIREVVNIACDGLDVNPLKLESSLTAKFKNNIKTSLIQEMLIQTCTSLATVDEPDWGQASGRLVLYDLARKIHKTFGISYDKTPFSEFFDYCIRNGYYEKKDFLDPSVLSVLDEHIKPENDMDYTIGGSLSLIKKYLIKNQKGTLELPQFADMAVSVYLNQNEKNTATFKKETLEDYKMISERFLSLATPFKSNLRKPGGNLSSCFIMEVDDSLKSLMKCYTDMANISANGGGIGVYLGKIRPENSLLRGGLPTANVINKWVKIINDIAVAVDQLGVRKGAITPALDIWHLDIHEFINMKTEVGELRLKSFDLFPQVVLNDLFIQAVRDDVEWYLLDRQEVQSVMGIDLVKPVEFSNHYGTIKEFILEGKLKHYTEVKAKALWKELLTIYIETGDLYMCNKDNMNSMNPMIDAEEFIQCGNLCLVGSTEIDVKINNKQQIITLEELYENYTTNDNILVKSFNHKTNEIEYKRITDVLLTADNADVIRITDTKTGKYIECTPEHKVWTKNRGYIEAQYLDGNDELEIYNIQEQSSNLYVKKITKKHTVYDINVEENQNFFANDVLVHNCQESFSPIKASTDFDFEYIDGRQYNSFKPGLTHTCNLVSLNLTKILNNEKLLEKATRRAVRILDKAIDITTVPVIEGELHNQAFRTIGIGTLGTADWMAYNKLSYNKVQDWDKLEALYEKISYYAFDESANIAQEKGSFERFNESNFKHGILLGKTAEELQKNSKAGLDWVGLSKKTSLGIRNMLLVAIAPNTSCQDGNNRIMTNDGIKSIYDILEEQGFDKNIIESDEPTWIDLKNTIKVPTLNGNDICEKIWYNGKEQYVEVTFEDGNSYKFTYNHKLLVQNDDDSTEWVMCGHLTGDEDIVNIGDL